MRAAVVGGSLGGLHAALLLADLGVEVDVYERSPAELVQRGAGIGFLPESARYLVERAGVALDRISVATSHIRYLGRRGRGDLRRAPTRTGSAPGTPCTGS